MNSSVRIRLSVMMFLQYFVWGAWFVTLGTYLGTALKFPGTAIGMCYAAIPIAGMISPFFVGIIADRFFAAERLLAALHLIGAGIMYYVSTEPGNDLVFPLLLAYAICYMPTLSLTNTVSFAEMKDPAKEFPGIRVLGTIGWIAAGMLIGKLRLSPSGTLSLSMGKAADTAASLVSIEATALPMKIAAMSSVILAIACLFLPHVPPKKDAKVSFGAIVGLDALRLMNNLSFAVFVIGSFLICIPLQFYYAFTGSFLAAINKVPDPAFTMTFGQISEIFFMLVFPLFFSRLGVKYMLLAGMAAWAGRYFLFGFGDANDKIWMLYLGLILHGVCYDFFFVTGQVYVDQQASEKIRAAAQGLIAFVTYGFGMFVGSIIQGQVAGHYAITEGEKVVGHHWKEIWIIPAFGAFGVLMLFLFFFSEKSKAAASTPSA